MHTRAHNKSLTEKRGDTITMRDMPVFSRSMRVNGQCDVVEFHRDDKDVSLFGREGLWMPCPVEYKRGKPKSHGALLGVEGNAASRYFSVFDELILQAKDAFFFRERSRRPPMDNVNALLSFSI